ncbi:UDP-N-acetylglucosamine--N-acetylmuramyl-(pentapeptide) pyrophosphoryl-undecaprenol N-acetylglucosamine transferase [Candidatus Kaiserbacteria bacterium]|nr:UDP-N-acetylglucosamine--N-acetylmuramyl-(pentapeptide) pyrophosphoryl-undecaprenol N-acetylglucosamine transferase [Candidatus Kaiserbacteria bacterium]MCB9811811.1 UDP-N-acetylglucosamine--N-acetylmuramyl-(pentapeptide) pyrophosphoryl-undecaprenol N-acetylglucosamine transferase [Candidatus Nomurabacteria bacterium]
MRVVLVGGGTGGHFYPLMAITEALYERGQSLGIDVEVLYMGPDPYDVTELERLHIEHVYCPAGKQRLYRSWRNFTDKFKIIGGIFVAFYKLFWLYPDVVMSKGGYTSIPVIIAAWLLRIPIVIHESDAVPGRANAFAARFSRYIGIAHDDAGPLFAPEKVALIGMPIRKVFFAVDPAPRQTLGIPEGRPLVFIVGGSSGAERINDLVINALDELLPNYIVLHQTGKANFEKVTETAAALVTDQSLLENYYVRPSLTSTEVAAALDAASVVVSRAGSGSIFEIALKQKPSILIPIPEDISRDQRKNAYSYARTGAAMVIEEHNLTDHMLAAAILEILEDSERQQTMKTAAASFTTADAAYTLADTLIGIGREHE